MKRIYKLIFGNALVFLMWGQASASLVVNGDFETGDFTGWGTLPIACISTEAHGGDYSARLGWVTGTIAQFVPVVAGQTYALEFWAKDNGASCTPQALIVTLGYCPLGNIDVFNPTPTWTRHFYTVTAPETGCLPLSFVWADGLKFAYVDTVSFTPVPEPSTVVAGTLLMLPLAAGAFRARFRKP